MSIKKDGSICLVCGDKATGKNFGAITCQPCKAFFRRNALLNNFECYFEDKCSMSLLTRKFCKKCRLSKCFAVGMNKDHIYDEIQKEKRRLKIEVNKRLRERYKHLNKISIDLLSVTNDNSDHLIDDLESDITSVSTINENTSYSECSDDINNNDNQLMLYVNENTVCDDLLNFNNISDLISQELQDIDFDTEIIQTMVDKPIAESFELNQIEVNLLKDLFEKTSVLRHPDTNHVVQLTDLNAVRRVTASKLDKEIRLLIDMSKHLTNFSNMCENDKIALLKYRCFESLFVRSVMIIDYSKSEIIYHLDNSLIKFDMELLNNNNVKGDLYNHFKYYWENIGPEWDSDPMIVEALTIISLFEPNCPNIKHKEIITYQQQLYMRLLYRYLKLRYLSESEAQLRFAKFMNAIKFADILGEKQRQNSSERSPQESGLLIAEILDINNQ
ncbi:nuclear hormone receptor HR96-like [Oppia nitens]|uniref:nuclear hormone receptor HR96-like n=1 Tax=Oppia nitens TaxID=1686743 RepID=UPI0023DB03F8|nr:nuclear hormone receptor HR96-like [Oppia nitens]